MSDNSGLGSTMSENKDRTDCQTSAGERRKALLSKIKILTISDLRKEWQSRSEVHVEKQKLNPFSDDFDYQHAMEARLHKGDEGYGRPEKGSKTEARGKRAQQHIHKEIEEMCLIIKEVGVRGRDGKIRVTFGRLFDRYVRISDKVVGILLRCRKHGHIGFEGEMLWQGVHDNVIITLLE
ncbi:PREDICTED: actin-binding Rho-activating protein-like [Nanorana parkeri]|uniref:actin-binding Rho-activating protein-like n=1 Tax=Nanorana parkeri TaxID=125878 RepID=UPI000854AB24|nr:PREDICTED: actin-binding Rho-activating protein-like [Nanorana parkeri]